MVLERVLLAVLLVALAEVAPYGEHNNPEIISISDAPNLTSNILIIGWDGVQRDHFFECRKGEVPGCSGLPHINNLSFGQIFNMTVTTSATATKPGWVEILTGSHAELLGVIDDKHFQSLPKGISIFEKFEKHFGNDGVVTIFLAGKDENLGGDCSDDPPGLWCEASKSLDHFQSGLGENDQVGRRALQLLETYKEKRILAFFHFQEPDLAGHMYGENSTQYTAALVDDDMWLGEIMEKLKELEIYEETLIYVITDHGFDEGRRTHENAPYGIMATNDPTIVRSGDRKDLAPTLFKRFGLGLGPEGGVPAVEGRSLDEISKGCIPEGGAYIDYAGAPGCCEGLDLVGLSKERSTWNGFACLPATGGDGDRSGYCVRCRDGIINEPENRCSCLE